MQTQDSKDYSCSEKSKLKDSKPAPPRDDTAESAKKEGKKKKRFWEKKRKCITDMKEQFPATGINAEAPKKKTRARYFNYKKKGHYANDCTKPLKN